jgi:hypothetical protein
MMPLLGFRPHRRTGGWLTALILSLGLLGADPAVAGDPDGVEVITSPDRGDVHLDRGFIRAVFTMRTRTWPDGKPVKVFVLPDESDAHLRFCKELLGIYPYILRNGWDRGVFTGTGLSPRTVDSLDEMVRNVRQTPGSIGYVVRVSSGS